MKNERQFHIDRHSLIVQMVLSFMTLALLTAVAVGIPAILLARNLLIICNPGQNHPHIGTPVSTNLCQLPNPTGLHIFSSEAPSAQVWMLATHLIGDETVDLGKVIVGTALDDAFIRQMSAQTGLEHTLLVNEPPAASSLPGGVDAWHMAIRQPVQTAVTNNMTAPATLILNGRP